jgi:large subunit ribosomal protein L18
MKFSKRILWKLKNKNKTLKPNIYKKLKRNSLRGLIKGTSERPRLSIYRSHEHIYAQIIDDENSITLVSCSTLDCTMQITVENRKTCYVSYLIGNQLAYLSLKKNIKKIVFDRGRYLYHGRVQAVADGARAGGLDF